MWKGWIYLLAPIFLLLISIKEAFRDILKSFHLSCVLPFLLIFLCRTPNGQKQDPESLEEMCSGQSRLGWSWLRTLDPAFRTAAQIIASNGVSSCVFTITENSFCCCFPLERQVVCHSQAFLVCAFSRVSLRVRLERRGKLQFWERVPQPCRQRRHSVECCLLNWESR